MSDARKSIVSLISFSIYRKLTVLVVARFKENIWFYKIRVLLIVRNRSNITDWSAADRRGHGFTSMARKWWKHHSKRWNSDKSDPNLSDHGARQSGFALTNHNASYLFIALTSSRGVRCEKPRCFEASGFVLTYLILWKFLEYRILVLVRLSLKVNLVSFAFVSSSKRRTSCKWLWWS